MNNKLFISVIAAVLLAGCTAGEIQEIGPRVFTAAVENPGTRTYLGKEAGAVRMYWTKGDEVRLFEADRSGKYVFNGDTGADHGPLRLDSSDGDYSGFSLSRNYALYPYDAHATISSGGVFALDMPAQQSYVADSFGPGAAMMVAVTASAEDTDLTFKSVVGYLVLKIYGTAAISSITLAGKHGEPLSGPATLTAGADTDPELSFGPGAGTTLTLNCGSGVTTGATAEEATTFWIAVAPTNFAHGITVTVTDTAGNTTEQSTNNPVSIVRNVYQPMAAFAVNSPTPGPDDPPVDPPTPDIPDLPTVNSSLAALYVYTDNNAPIVDKVTWIQAHAYLKAADGTVTDLGTATIRGRGNTTWKNFDKKPYALKLNTKADLLGMPKDKRWDLLANAVDRTRMRNDIALELGRRLSPDHNQHYFDWTPRGEFVELVLNGTHVGNYYLVEHIKIASKRVPIKEMKATDVAEPEITGGYLIEMSTEMDETNKFYTTPFADTYPYPSGLHGGSGKTYKLPVMIKDPDEDVMQPVQFTWIQNYINGLQGHIVSNNADWEGDWTTEVDMDSFICWMFVQEIVGNAECLHPKSSYMHKDREGKLVMGPLWDFDYATFKDGYAATPVYHYSIWYPYMLRNSTFNARVKELWPIVRPLLRDVANNYIEARAAQIKASVNADWAMWPTSNNINADINMSFDEAVASLKSNLNRRINQMTNEVNNM